MDQKTYEVIILGGGISGLTSSYYLGDVPHLLLESGSRFGGAILSLKKNEGILECGPNFLLLRKTEAKEIICELGLDKDLLAPPKESRRRFVLLPSGLIALTPLTLFKHLLLKSPLTNWKLMVGGTSLKRGKRFESVFDFFTRKFSPYFAVNFARPMVSGIFGGDARRILVSLAFPLFAGFDKKYNSFWPGTFFHFLKKKKHSLPSGLYSFKDGLEHLISTLKDKSQGDLRLNHQVQALSYENGLWKVKTSQGVFFSKKLISSLPAYEMAKLFPENEKLKTLFLAINYPWLSVMFLSYKTEQIKNNPQGFGFLNSQIEKKTPLGCFYTSSMFPNRFKEGETLFTIFIGGTLRQDLKSSSQEELALDVHRELDLLFKIEGKPLWSHLHSWEKAIAQYEKPVAEFREFFEKNKLFDGSLYLTTNFMAGVSVPDCMINAKNIALNIKSGGSYGSQV